jgi:hypothetical protein
VSIAIIASAIYGVFIYAGISDIDKEKFKRILAESSLITEVIMLAYIILKNIVRQYGASLMLSIVSDLICIGISILGLLYNNLYIILITMIYGKGIGILFGTITYKLYNVMFMKYYGKHSSGIYDKVSDRITVISSFVSITIGILCMTLVDIINWEIGAVLLIVLDTTMVYIKTKVLIYYKRDIRKRYKTI